MGQDFKVSGAFMSGGWGNVALTVRNVLTGAQVPEFRYLVNEDNVGDPQVELPEDERDPNLFPSLKPGASHSPVVLAGESRGTSTAQFALPAGKYLISVLAPGFKLGTPPCATKPTPGMQ